MADDEVVPDALLLHLLEVLGHDLLHLIQEAEKQRHVAVGAAGGHDVDVAVLDVGEGAVVGLDQGPREALVLDIIDKADEVVDYTVVNVPPVVPVEEDLALVVKEVDGTARHDLE